MLIRCVDIMRWASRWSMDLVLGMLDLVIC